MRPVVRQRLVKGVSRWQAVNRASFQADHPDEAENANWGERPGAGATARTAAVNPRRGRRQRTRSWTRGEAMEVAGIARRPRAAELGSRGDRRAVGVAGGIPPTLDRSRPELDCRIGDGDQGGPPLRHSSGLHIRTAWISGWVDHLVRRSGGPRLSVLGSALRRLFCGPRVGAAAIASHRAERPDRLSCHRVATSARTVDSGGCNRLPGCAGTGALPTHHQPPGGRRGVIRRPRGAGETLHGSHRGALVPGRRDRCGSALVAGARISRADGSGDPAPLAARRAKSLHDPGFPGEHLAGRLRLQRGNARTGASRCLEGGSGHNSRGDRHGRAGGRKRPGTLPGPPSTLGGHRTDGNSWVRGLQGGCRQDGRGASQPLLLDCLRPLDRDSLGQGQVALAVGRFGGDRRHGSTGSATRIVDQSQRHREREVRDGPISHPGQWIPAREADQRWALRVGDRVRPRSSDACRPAGPHGGHRTVGDRSRLGVSARLGSAARLSELPGLHVETRRCQCRQGRESHWTGPDLA